jgi:hypothetical protein
VAKALGLAMVALGLVAAAEDSAPLTRLDEQQLEIQRLARPFGLPLNNPPAVGVADATHMKPDDLVFGVAVGNRFRAYPQWALIGYHVVNDTIGPYALVVTHCEVCSAAAAFRAEVEIGKSGPVPLGFRMCGMGKGTFDICDDVTTSRWQPFLGLAEDGPLQGVTLTRLPVTVEDWKTWSERFPSTDVVVMSRSLETREHGQGFKFGAPGVPGPFRAGANLSDTRLPESAIVFGLAADGQAVAVPLDSLALRGAARTVALGSRRYLVFRSSRHGANAFELPAGNAAYRTADGEPFALESDAGGRWNELGRAHPATNDPGDLHVATAYQTDSYERDSHNPKSEIAR